MGTITLRNVPLPLYRKLRARAKASGLSLPAYLRQEFRRIAKLPTEEEMLRRLERLSKPKRRAARSPRRKR